MNERAAQIFNHIDYLRCPLCGETLSISDMSLKCLRAHCYDISSKGYVNFIPNQKQTKYNRDFFINRRLFLEGGFYDHILKPIQAVVEPLQEVSLFIDAGCGEGYFSRKLRSSVTGKLVAFDLSKYAIKAAAQNCSDICFLVSDISNIPVSDNSAGVLLNMFTPANYSEFTRVLKPEGILIKVVPGANHLIELRNTLKGDTYDNSNVVGHLSDQFSIIESIPATKTYELNEDHKRILLKMTPMTFDMDDNQIDPDNFSNITIDALILVCRKSISR